MVHVRLRSSEAAAAHPFFGKAVFVPVIHARIYPLRHPADPKDVTGGSLKCRLYLIVTAGEMGIPRRPVLQSSASQRRIGDRVDYDPDGVLALINYTVSYRDGFTFISSIDLFDRIHSLLPARPPISNRLTAVFHATGVH
jgi:hypothetical protein